MKTTTVEAEEDKGKEVKNPTKNKDNEENK